MTGGQPPEIKSFNDYLTYVLPVCFGVLKMTAEEIRNSTPWEINMRIRGYEDRQRQTRLLLASFVTLPVINSSFCRPKKGLELKDIVPDDLRDEPVTEGEFEKWREILSNAKRG